MDNTVSHPLRAGVAIRVAATLLDLAIFTPLLFFAAANVGRWMDASPVWISVMIGNGMALLYSLSEVAFAATPGKLLLGLRIVAADGQPAVSSALLLRFLAKHAWRVCALVAAVSDVLSVRLIAAQFGFAVFRDSPLDFVTLRAVGELALLGVVAGFFLTLRPRRQTLHDLLSDTCVSRRTFSLAKRGFEPVLPRPVLIESVEQRISP